MLVGEDVVLTRVEELTSSALQTVDCCYDWIFGFKLAPLVITVAVGVFVDTIAVEFTSQAYEALAFRVFTKHSFRYTEFLYFSLNTFDPFVIRLSRRLKLSFRIIGTSKT